MKAVLKPERKLLNIDELATVLNATHDQIVRWARKGQIPCVRINRKQIRFDLQRVLTALDD